MRKINYVLLFFLFGCSAQRYYHVDSMPGGASIFRAGEFVGQAPVGFKYKITQEDRKRGYFYSRPLVLEWVSGAKWQTDGFKINLQDENYHTYVINRPESAPNKMTDVNYALELQKIDIMNSQLSTMRRAVYLQNLQTQNYNSLPTYQNNSLQQSIMNLQSALQPLP